MNQKANPYMSVVNQIPVDQTARATASIKSFLIEQVKLIVARKEVIEKATKDKKKEAVLDAYKKSVGFEQKSKRITAIQKELEELREELTKKGLTVDGDLIKIEDKKIPPVNGMYKVWTQRGGLIEISADTMNKILKVQELLKAVEGEIEPYTQYDQLMTRMMMATTVGEAMAIVNALVGEPIFNIESQKLGLPDKK